MLILVYVGNIVNRQKYKADQYFIGISISADISTENSNNSKADQYFIGISISADISTENSNNSKTFS